MSIEDNKTVALMLSPFTDGATEVHTFLQEDEAVQVESLDDLEAVVVKAKTEAPCLAVFSIKEAAQIIPIVGQLSKIKNLLKEGKIKAVVFSAIKNPQLTAAMETLFVAEYLEEPQNSRTLKFKIQLQIKAVIAVKKREAMLLAGAEEIRLGNGEGEKSSTSLQSQKQKELLAGVDLKVSPEDDAVIDSKNKNKASGRNVESEPDNHTKSESIKDENTLQYDEYSQHEVVSSQLEKASRKTVHLTFAELGSETKLWRKIGHEFVFIENDSQYTPFDDFSEIMPIWVYKNQRAPELDKLGWRFFDHLPILIETRADCSDELVEKISELNNKILTSQKQRKALQEKAEAFRKQREANTNDNARNNNQKKQLENNTQDGNEASVSSQAESHFTNGKAQNYLDNSSSDLAVANEENAESINNNGATAQANLSNSAESALDNSNSNRDNVNSFNESGSLSGPKTKADIKESTADSLRSDIDNKSLKEKAIQSEQNGLEKNKNSALEETSTLDKNSALDKSSTNQSSKNNDISATEKALANTKLAPILSVDEDQDEVDSPTKAILNRIQKKMKSSSSAIDKFFEKQKASIEKKGQKYSALPAKIAKDIVDNENKKLPSSDEWLRRTLPLRLSVSDSIFIPVFLKDRADKIACLIANDVKKSRTTLISISKVDQLLVIGCSDKKYDYLEEIDLSKLSKSSIIEEIAFGQSDAIAGYLVIEPQLGRKGYNELEKSYVHSLLEVIQPYWLNSQLIEEKGIA